MSGTHIRSLFEGEQSCWQLEQNPCRRLWASHYHPQFAITQENATESETGKQYGTIAVR